MAVQRDYGSFAKASARLLSPQVRPLGYRPRHGGEFAREKSGWVEAFFLQQSQWGSGNFCVNIGIDVPALNEFYDDRNFGLLIGWRLSDAATEHGGERWYRAKDSVQLQNNLKLVADALAKAEPWFHQFDSFSNVVEQYRVRSGLPEVPAGDLRVVCALNYGLLLLLDHERAKAAQWLRFARDLLARPIYWNQKTKEFSHQQLPGLKLMKRSKDDELRTRAIETALSRLES
jgi:hypothetical protein